MTDLTRADEMYIAACLLARAKHKSKQLKHAKTKPMDLRLVKYLKEEVTKCTRLAGLLRQGPSHGTGDSDASR